jgi:hypothetical protein
VGRGLAHTFVADIADRRMPCRAAHLELARAAHERGELALGGAFTDAPAGAVPVFRGGDAAGVEAFVAADPYVANGLVTIWTIRPLQVAFGGCGWTQDRLPG